ncbi:MAG: betaine-aldehyde dehydrogenase [Alphaproteobacteria bacterium]
MSGLMDIFAHLQQEGVQLSSIINGAAVKSPLPATPKINPATGAVIASIEPASPEMLDDAVRYAAAAQKDWAARAAHERAEILSYVARLITEHVDVLSRLEVLDVGKLYSEAVSADVPSGAESFAFFAAACATAHGTSHRWPDAIAYTERVPLGVCAGIGAWNYPIQVASWKAAPALAAGNAFILKPSEETPLTANALAAICREAGMPDGLFQVLHGDHVIGQAICAHRGIAKVSLTGGVDTGKLIVAQSAASLKKVTLELGGKAPLLVFADADFDLAVQLALDANFYTAGEVCSNATRVFVEDSIADKFIQAVSARAAEMHVGDPMSPDMQMGAIVSEEHLIKVLGDVAVAKQQGAIIAAGGTRLHPAGVEGGYYMAPTVLTGCTDEMACVTDEIFGPVMSILRFTDEDDAVRRANNTHYGLGAGIVTSDLTRAHRVAGHLEAGNIWVNSYNLIPPGLPFGGSKQSGMGREGSLYALESYTEVKATYIQL